MRKFSLDYSGHWDYLIVDGVFGLSEGEICVTRVHNSHTVLENGTSLRIEKGC
jgi:hypothetical protein